jgi:ABC-2 type transport system permease protein
VVYALFVADLKMIYRDRQALFWALAFPLIFLVIFALFDFEGPVSVRIAVVDRSQNEVSQEFLANLGTLEMLEIETETDEAAARQRIAEGDLSYLLIVPEGLSTSAGATGDTVSLTLVFDEDRVITNQMVAGLVQRFLGEANLSLQGVRPLMDLRTEGISGRQVSYFDFLLPGLVGMGVMTFSIIGMASVLTLYRQQRILRRIQATPLRVRTFFAAQILAWLVLSLGQAAIILLAGTIIFGARVYGNVAWVVPLVILANLTFLNLGFIVGSIAKTVNAASGLGNAVAMPMMFLSGVFFPTDSLPTIMARVVAYLPLSPMLEAMRGVLLDANPLYEYPAQLALLVAWVVVTGVVAIRAFRFD